MNNVAGIDYACKAPASWISHSRKLFLLTLTSWEGSRVVRIHVLLDELSLDKNLCNWGVHQMSVQSLIV